MEQKRTSDLAILYIEKTLLKLLDVDQFIDHYAGQKAKQITL